MTERYNFRRVILGLHHNVPRHGLRLAAEVAALLRIELCGLLVKEDELAGLAAFPFAREFRPLEGGWRALELGQLSHDLDVVADRAQKSFAAAARALGLSCRFEVRRCSMAEAITSVSRAGDIVIVSEPASPAEGVTWQYPSMVNAALGSAAAVMVVPPRIMRQRGSVVAVAATPEDESIAVAALIAARANEEVVVIETFDRIVDAATSKPAVTRLFLTGASGRDSTALLAVLHPLRERLVVMTRGTSNGTIAATIASSRHVPVLIVEPGKMSPAPSLSPT